MTNLTLCKEIKSMPIQFPNTNYKYYDPNPHGECDHPSGTKVVQTIYQDLQNADHSYALAKIDESGTQRYAIRWNIAHLQYNNSMYQSGQKVCLGFPYSHSYPTWFVLPAGAFINQNGNLEIPLK